MRSTQRTPSAAMRAATVLLMAAAAAMAGSAVAAATPAAAAKAGNAAPPAEAPAAAAGKPLQLPPRQEIRKHESYQSTPDLQQTPGGGLVVNAFIMDGPVRVEVRDRDSGKLLLEKKAETLFPFEVPRRKLGVEATRVVVRIYVKGELAHELTMQPGH